MAGKAVLMDAPGPPTPLALEAERRGAVALLMRGGVGDGPVLAGGERLHEFPTGSGDDGRFDSLVAVILDDDSVTALREALASGPVRVGLSGEDATDDIAAFSSRGPTATFGAKPDLVAPGVEIRSSVPAALHAPGVARFSGTSMAAPHVAGAAALVRQLHPDWPAAAVRSALAGASEQLDGPPLLSGAGRLDVAAAADAAVVADATALSFGLAGTEEQVDRTRTLTVSNVSDKPADVRVKPRAAAGPPVEVSPSLLALKPGEHRAVTVTLRADAPAEDVQGWVDLDVGGRAADIRVPYALPVRALHVVVSPDPADDRTEAFIATPAELGAPPVVEVRGPDGVVTRATARHDHDQWWRATLEGRGEGVYRVRASAPVTAELGRRRADRLLVVRGRRAGRGRRLGADVAPGRTERARRRARRRAGRRPAHVRAQLEQPGRLGLPRRRRDVAGPTGHDRHRRLPRRARAGSGPPRRAVPGAQEHRDRADVPGPGPAQRRRRPHLDLAPGARRQDAATSRSTAGGEVLAAATSGGLYAGEAGGSTWEPVAGPWTGVTATQLVGNDLYAATDRGLFVVDGFVNGGRTPRRVDAAGGTRYEEVTGNARLLVAHTGFALRGSTDGGRTWDALPAPPKGGRIWSLSVVGRTAYVGTFLELWVGDRGATRWQDRPRPIPAQSVGDVRPHPSGAGLLVAAPASGVYTSTDGMRTYDRIGVPGVSMIDVAVAENRAGKPWLLAGTRNDTYRTPLPRKPQIEPADLEWGFNGHEGAADSHARVAVAPSRPQVVYKTVETPLARFYILRSEDGGETWRQIGQGNDAATALHVDPHDPDRAIVGFFALKGSGVLRTEDGGATWERVRRDAPPAGLAADPRDGDRLWLADADGLHRSTDGGRTFTRRHDAELGAVAVDPADPDHLIAGGRRLHVSEDGGATLRPAFYADLELAIEDIVFDPVRPGVAYAAAACSYPSGLPRGGRGVLRTTDGGRTWGSFAAGLDDLCVHALAVAPDGRTLFAATGRTGVQRMRLVGNR